MCFYYSINKSKADTLKKEGVISLKALEKIHNRVVMNGFEHPLAPVISNLNPQDVEYYRWGLVPNTISTASDADSFLKQYNTLNAKGETAYKSKIYNYPLMHNRCLVMASGFFEWQHTKGRKTPYYISLYDDSLFAFAGIWDSWRDEYNAPQFTFSILTTPANELLAKIHNTKKRMPAILHASMAKEWLNPNLKVKDIEEMIEPIESNALKAHTIRPFLNLNQQQANFESVLEPFTAPDDSKSAENNQLSINW